MEELRSQDTQCLHTLIEGGPINNLVQTAKKLCK